MSYCCYVAANYEMILCLQYYITEHGHVAGEDHMMAEIYTRGPIACTIAVTSDFEKYSGGIFNDTTGAKVTSLDIMSIFIHLTLFAYHNFPITRLIFKISTY